MSLPVKGSVSYIVNAFVGAEPAFAKWVPRNIEYCASPLDNMLADALAVQTIGHHTTKKESTHKENRHQHIAHTLTQDMYHPLPFPR